MYEELREEFQILNSYGEELRRALVRKVCVAIYRLLEIADHTTVCDHIAKTETEKNILRTTAHYWEKCAEQWVKNKLDRTEAVQSIKSIKTQSLEMQREEITKNDKLFLSSLGISTDIPVSDNEDGGI